MKIKNGKESKGTGRRIKEKEKARRNTRRKKMRREGEGTDSRRN